MRILIVVVFAIVCMLCVVIGVIIGYLVCRKDIEEKREEMELNDEINIWINGQCYNESEIINLFGEMQDEIKELKKSAEFYRTMADNAMLERNDESEVCD